MFNKLLTNLAFSPSSIEQVSFYSRRLRQEQSIRRIGLILIVISMFIQLFAAMIPPQKSLAASKNNDVIAGGVDNLSQLKDKYNAHADVRALYGRFGLNANDLNNAKNVSFKFQAEGKLGTRTVGRVNFASTKDHNLGELGGSTFYSRSASEWQGSEPAYYFGKQQGTDGGYYFVWVLKNCGNIAYRTTTAPPKPKPKPVKQTPTKTPTPTVTTTSTPEPTPTQTTTPTPTPTPTPTSTPKPQPEKPTKPKPVCANNPALKPDDILCKCVENPSITADDARCTTPGRSKKAKNLTHPGAKKAVASDVIEYTLTTKNTNVVAKTDVVIEDYIGDVLDYANLDTAYLESQGGTYIAETKTVQWTGQKIPAKDDITKTFRVNVKSVIPSTNQPNATATDFDCKMQNGYGNEIIIPVDCAPIKEIEKLPNTGPGLTAFVGFTVSSISGYFYMRARLLGKELGIIKKTYQQSGGM